MESNQSNHGILRRDVLVAEEAARRISAALEQRGLKPSFYGHYLTRYAGILLLISELKVSELGRLEAYMTDDLRHQISTSLQGTKVYLSNTTGLRYVVPLSKPRGLPQKIEYPADTERGKLALGVNYLGNRVAVEWGDLGHMLVAGMTGSGKSMFLRLVAYQAIRDGMKLLLADIDQATFPMLAGHSALLAPIAVNAADAFEMIRQALAECDRRAALFQGMAGYPENLDEYNRLAVKNGKEPLPRVLLALDEFSATLSTLGGGKSDAAQLLAAIGFRGRKFGVSVVFAAHEFTKEQVGLLRDQVRTVAMLRVQSKEMAKRLGCEGAERISAGRPGLAMTNRWGPMQTYFLDKGMLVDGEAMGVMGVRVSAIEQTIFNLAASSEGGLVTRERVMRWGGVSEWQARKWMEAWALRGWIAKDAKNNNAYRITAKLPETLSNHPTAPTAGSGSPTAPTVLQPAS
jgi:hypothetical protein